MDKLFELHILNIKEKNIKATIAQEGVLEAKERYAKIKQEKLTHELMRIQLTEEIIAQ